MNSKTLLQLLELLDKNPEDSKRELSELFNGVKPLVIEAYGGLIDIIDEISKDKRCSEIYARLLKNRFDALVDAGFTKPQAMEIILNTQYGINNLINKNK